MLVEDEERLRARQFEVPDQRQPAIVQQKPSGIDADGNDRMVLARGHVAHDHELHCFGEPACSSAKYFATA